MREEGRVKERERERDTEIRDCIVWQVNKCICIFDMHRWDRTFPFYSNCFAV